MRILIAFGTLTGNTELVASHLAEKIEEVFPQHECDLKNQFEVLPPQLLEYDLLIMGGSSWGESETNPITDEFIIQLTDQSPELAGKPVAIFALGESIYEDFCAAARILEAKFTELGGKITGEVFKIDGFPEDEILEDAWNWCQEIISQLDGK